MRVALVGAHPPVGEPDGNAARPDRGTAVAALAAALTARGAEVTVYAARHDAQTPETAVVDGYRVVRIRQVTGESAGELAAALNDFAQFLVGAWASDRPDVVHADTWMLGVAAQLAADHHGIPTVQSFPQLGAVLAARQGRVVGPPARARFERLLARGATRVAAACTEDVAELIRMGCPRSRIVVLPQGVDVDVFAPMGPEAERAARAPAGFRIVASVDELLPHQGLDDLIRATLKLPRVELLIVGGPEYHRPPLDAEATRLRRLVTNDDAAQRIRFTGALPAEQRAAVLRSADVFACPSWYESSNVALLEAMACGVPVVAAEAGAMVDLVVDDVTGVLVPPRNPVALLAALAAMLHGGPLREGMGLAGRARARSCHGWDRVAEEVANVHERAVSGYVAGSTHRSGAAALAN